jgi:osmoprotectant transport system substrate-binding protein
MGFSRAFVYSASAAVLAVGAAACGGSSSGGSAPAGGSSPASGASASLCGGATGSGSLVVGDAPFSENETLAAVYAAALDKCGYSATVKNIGARQVLYPALTSGKVQVSPEYAASLADFVNESKNGANAPSVASGDITTTVAHLKAELPPSLAVLNAAAATDKNAFAVTQQFSQQNHITTLSQLATYSQSHTVTLGAPAECSSNAFCGQGLQKVYGMKIASYKSLNEDPALTEKAVNSGTVTFGEVFTSDPTVAKSGLVVLQDDKALEASDNIIPLVSSKLVGTAAANALNAVQAKLSQAVIVQINTAVEIHRASAASVAQQFIQQEFGS